MMPATGARSKVRLAEQKEHATRQPMGARDTTRHTPRALRERPRAEMQGAAMPEPAPRLHRDCPAGV